MEKRLLFGPDSVRQWSTSESTVEASTNRMRTQTSTLHWHITVDHFGGEAKYPIGWPRVNIAIKEPAARDWSGWDYLQLWVYTETSREALPHEPVVMILHTPDKESAYNRPLDGLKKGEWAQIRIPLTQVPRHQEVRLMQLSISDSKYRHQDQLDLYFDEIALFRYAQPTLLDFAAESMVMFTDANAVPVRFNLVGIKPGESVDVVCELRQDGKTAARTIVKAKRGPQRLALDLGGARLAAGNYELAASAAGVTQTATTEMRLVASPWQ